MKLQSTGIHYAVRTAICFSALCITAQFGLAERNYQQPAFQQAVFNQQDGTTPGAFLAGGPAAAQGGHYMDVQGNPIALQTSYCQSCPPGYGAGGYGGGGYGDPMAVDFGGYGEDQCGPHYFDVSFDTVFLQGEDLFKGLSHFGSVTAAADAPRILDPNDSADDYEPGWRIAARYDIGALAVLEATYMGLYDIGFTSSITSEQGNQLLPVPNPVPADKFLLQSVFSGFGAPIPLDGIDAANFYSLKYESDLQSTEISYRRYWLGNNPRISGTWLIGARYIRMTDTLRFLVQDASGVLPDSNPNDPLPAFPNDQFDSSSRIWDSENDMVGFQFGGDGWIALRQGLRIGGEMKTGIYNNRFKFRHTGDFGVGAGGGLTPPDNFDVLTRGNQVAFAAEGGVTMVADILSSWSLRGGYQVLYMNSIATAGGNVNTGDISAIGVQSQDSALYHGFNGGLEYVW